MGTRDSRWNQIRFMSSRQLFFILLFFLLPNTSLAEEIRIVSFPYPPYLTSENTGIIYDLVEAAAKNAGLTPDLKIYPRKRAMRAFKKNNGLMFLGERRYFPALQDTLDARRLMYSRGGIVYMKEKIPAGKIKRIEDGAGYSVGLSLGGNMVPVFEKAGWDVHPVTHLDSIIKMLVAGRIDCWGTADLTAISLINKLYPENRDAFYFQELEKISVELVSVKNDHLTPLFNRFSRGFDKLVESGEYRKILERFYGKGMIPESVLMATVSGL